MVYVRKSVWAAGGDFSDPILFWYAKGVELLKQRLIAEPTSWRFLGAVHGFDADAWRKYGYLNNDDLLPSQSVRDLYWDQCQHQTWYFLPWHRGYLASLEAIIRDAIVQVGGPARWALPYWNYSDTTNPNALELPPAFSSPTMPDGTPNPLFVSQRYGASFTPPSLPLPVNDVSLQALNSSSFKGQADGGSPGFGGVETGFSHFGGVNGRLESIPHNIIHVDVGRWLGEDLGLMTDPNTAGLDPIFWLHHCNIDRLWEVWLYRNFQNQNPTEDLWLDGPIDRQFIVPLPNGQDWEFAPRDVTQTTAPNLDYIYDNIVDPLESVIPTTARLNRLGAPPSQISAFIMSTASESNPELIGANSNRLVMTGASVSTQVRLDSRMLGQVSRSFAPLANAETNISEPDQIFLNLENIRCDRDGAVIDVYVNLGNDDDPTEHPELLAGSIALFGVRNASSSEQPHGGQGVTEVLDITSVVDRLYLSQQLDDLTNLDVSFISRSELTESENVSVERVSIYRQGR